MGILLRVKPVVAAFGRERRMIAMNAFLMTHGRAINDMGSDGCRIIVGTSWAGASGMRQRVTSMSDHEAHG
jgi:hypothetical protein